MSGNDPDSNDIGAGPLGREVGVEFLFSVVLSLGFGLFWMWWYYRQDVYEKEPKRFVALIFLLSMPLSVLAGLLEYTLDKSAGGLSEQQGFVVAVLFNVVIVAGLEELAKFFVVYTVAYPNRAFNESMDGIIYAAAAALGFASFENIFYVLDKGPVVLLLRGPFSTLGHVLFSAMWGSALGMALHEPERGRRIRLIATGLGLSILAHGFYNSLVSLSHPFFPGFEWLALSGVVFLGGLYALVSFRISQALNLSVFNPANQARSAIQRLRERRQQYQAQLTADRTPGVELPPSPELPPPLRYAPNPNRYQLRGPSLSGRQPSTQPTRACPNCGAANLVDPPADECYNCGYDLTSLKTTKNDE